VQDLAGIHAYLDDIIVQNQWLPEPVCRGGDVAYSRFVVLAACGALCLCSFHCRVAQAQAKDALASAPPPANKSAPQNEAGVKAAVTTPDLAPQTAAFLGASADRPQVRLVGLITDVAKRYRAIIPPLPVPPFSQWRQWFQEHENSVHCLLEWCNEKGEWFHGELRSTHFGRNAERYRVGWGEFPGTGYDAYGIYILPGRVQREKDPKGKPVVVKVDEEVSCDYRQLEAQIRRYGAKYARPGDPGTGGAGKENVGLGGPAYKPAQNSNTMVKYVLRACGFVRPTPELAVGWETEPDFPFSSNADMPPPDGPP